jgi:hypothetical protein
MFSFVILATRAGTSEHTGGHDDKEKEEGGGGRREILP